MLAAVVLVEQSAGWIYWLLESLFVADEYAVSAEMMEVKQESGVSHVAVEVLELFAVVIVELIKVFAAVPVEMAIEMDRIPAPQKHLSLHN